MSIKRILEKLDQEHLLPRAILWDEAVQKKMLDQLELIDASLLLKQKKLLEKNEDDVKSRVTPLEENDIAKSSPFLVNVGLGEINKGSVGVILAAGGQGTRLGFEGPKGCYPITPVKNKSLFQLFAEKIAAASLLAGRLIPLAILTSEDNDEATRTFFHHHKNFGLDVSQVSFFTQRCLPFLDSQGRLFYQDFGKIASGPNGNGDLFFSFRRSGLLETWRQTGIQYAMFLQIDNPLADPIDLEMIGLAASTGSEVVAKGVERISPEEKVGVFAKHGDRLEVIEYSEMPPSEFRAIDREGCLAYRLANISFFCFSLKFMEKVSFHELPLHKAFKASSFLNDGGIKIESTKPNAWKFEHYIFDCLPFASQVSMILAPREDCFAPLKNRDGLFSEGFVKAALTAKDRKVLEKITGHPISTSVLEIDPRFYYPTSVMLKKWQGRHISPLPYVACENTLL